MADLPAPAAGTSSVIRKVVVTALSGGIAYAVTTVAQQDPAWSVTLSILIGGVALVIQFLMDFEERLTQLEHANAAHAARVERRLEDTFRTVNEATELFGLLEESALQGDVVTQLVKHSTQIKAGLPNLVHGLAESELVRTSVFLKELGDGDAATYDGEDRDWLLALARLAKRSISAMSMMAVDAAGQGPDSGLWTSDLGKRYLDAQSEARGRDVAVRRLVVLDSTMHPDQPEVLRLCALHREAGVELRILEPAKARTSLQTALFDFVLFDEEVSYELTTGQWSSGEGGPIIVSTRLVLQPARVASRLRDFERAWEAGIPSPAPPSD